jgi:UDP-N-acetylglucosamine 2-epimerase (non-hydrolysing)
MTNARPRRSIGRWRVITIVGTRPEVIKMSPVILELQRRESYFEPVILTTGQHRELLDQAFSDFGLKSDSNLELMEPNQELSDFSSRALKALSYSLAHLKADLVLVEGDTSTVMTAALAAFYLGIPVGHVEAGLRSYDPRNPFPEEINRRITSCLGSWHFAPTERARDNLLREGVRKDSVFLTGNTVVDALRIIPLEGRFESDNLPQIKLEGRRVLLVTAHRRENQGPPLRSICRALRDLVQQYPDLEVVYPVHPNPNVTSLVHEELAGISRIHLLGPVSYTDLLRLMKHSYMVLTDSGGIQEEAPSFHKPVLVLREVTERPELVEVGGGRIVGTDAKRILEETSRLLTDSQAYEKMSNVQNPFGDGFAARRIIDAIEKVALR